MIPIFHFKPGTDFASWIVHFALALAIVYVISRSGIGYTLRSMLIPPGSCTPNHPLISWLATGVYCVSCTGWWVGAALGALHYFPISCGWLPLDVFISGCLTMIVSTMWFQIADPGGNGLLELEHPEMFLQEADVKAPEEEGAGK